MSRVSEWIDSWRTRPQPRVRIRHPEPRDAEEFITLMRRSESLHRPWIFPPTTAAGFDEYMQRMRRDDHAGFLVCETQTNAIAGVININNIVRGTFLSASLGYYAGLPYAGSGLMREGLKQVVSHAFQSMSLHRLEANIQPSNAASIALVKSCGFQLEGVSPDFLYIDGAWRDHERWALINRRNGLF